MPSPPESRTDEGTPKPQLARTLLIAFALLTALAMLGTAYVAYRVLGVSREALPETTVEEREGPSVVVAIQSLARLESVAFHMERVVDIKSTDRALWGLVQAEDSLLLIAAGDVIAGVDLRKLKPEHVVVDHASHSVRIELPPPEVFSARLDNQRTYVHSRKTDLLKKPDVTLESEARKRAEQAIRDGALDAGILQQAEESAASTVRALLGSLGYRNVSVSTQGE